MIIGDKVGRCRRGEPDDRVLAPKIDESLAHKLGSYGRHLDGDVSPLAKQAVRLLARVGDADELLGEARDDLLLEEAGAAALDAVELGVDLVGAVEVDVEVLAARAGAAGEADLGEQLGDLQDGQPGVADEARRAGARGHELHARRHGRAQRRDGLHHVRHRAPAADPHVLEARREVVLDGLLARRALRGLDEVRVDGALCCHCASRDRSGEGGGFAALVVVLVIGLEKPLWYAGLLRAAGTREGGGRQLTAR